MVTHRNHSLQPSPSTCPTQEASYQGDDKEGEKDEEQDLGNPGGRTSDTPEAKRPGDNGND
jgi:hypothetical protein